MKILEIISGIYSKIHLDEVSMKPAHLEKWAASPETEGMLMGIEFELYFPNAMIDTKSHDENVYDIDDIVNFFEDYVDGNRLRDQLMESFLEWMDDQIANSVDTDEIKRKIAESYDIDQFIDDAKEHLANEEDVSENDIRNLAEKLMNEAIEDSYDYEDSYYDDAYQEHLDELRDDFDGTESDWLSNMGVNTAEDASNHFDIVWPYGDDEGILDIHMIADLLNNELGYSTVASDSYHGVKKSLSSWTIEPDSSLSDAHDNNDSGIEIVSPPLPISEMLVEMDRFIDWAKSHDCYTNYTTGLHMNISVPDFSKEKLDYVKLALFMGDDYVLQQFQRETNSFCTSAIKKIKEAKNNKDIQMILDKMRQHLNTSVAKLIYEVNTQKYTSINTHKDRVEFRSPGGDWLNQDIKKLSSTAIRLVMALKIACDENAYKQEYAKKLYKFLSKSSENLPAINLISLYSAGLIDKAGLINRLKQAWQKPERFIMKDPKAAYEYARNVKGPWPEAEPYIVQDPKYAELYAKNVLKVIHPETWANRYKHGVDKPVDINTDPRELLNIAVRSRQRWPDAEPIIMRYPRFAYDYTMQIINANKSFSDPKERWPEAEPYIAQDPEYAYEYALYVLRSRFPKAEQFIIKNPKWAYLYVYNVINYKNDKKDIPWPDAEPYIVQNESVAKLYAEDILKDPHPETWRERYLQGKVK